jgi:hypothetical protein
MEESRPHGPPTERINTDGEKPETLRIETCETALNATVSLSG